MYMRCGIEMPFKVSNVDKVFVMPLGYYIGSFSKEHLYIIFDVLYPGMQTIRDEEVPRDDQIGIVMRLNDGQSTPEYFVETAKDRHRFDPNKPGLCYLAGQKGPYQVYRRRPGEISYVFRAADGELVRGEDDDRSPINTFDRRVEGDLQFRYYTQKPIALANNKDFIRIDQVVTDFIKRNSRLQSDFVSGDTLPQEKMPFADSTQTDIVIEAERTHIRRMRSISDVALKLHLHRYETAAPNSGLTYSYAASSDVTGILPAAAQAMLAIEDASKNQVF